VIFVVSENQAKERGSDHHHHHRHRHFSYNYHFYRCRSNKVSMRVTNFKEFFSSLKLIGGVSTFYKRHKNGGDKIIF
jgi:hypothetical protein